MTKTPAEVEKMAASGALLASVFTLLDRTPLAGMTTMQVNDLVEDYITRELQARPASKGQYDFPYVLNSSKNEVVCHGMPSDDEIIENGEIINFDITLEKDGYIADSSKTYMVGDVAPFASRLVRVTYEALWKGIAAVRPGATLGDIGHAIERHAKRHDYSIVREYCGHGIGKVYHEQPNILHYGQPGQGIKLVPGMVFTIEPMVNMGKARVKELKDGWTVVTTDKSWSAQWEHMVYVTETGFEVLSPWPEGTGEYPEI